MIYETAPAKINLTLDTLFKRDDGFHEVEMIMTTIDLNDRLSFELRKDKKIVVDVEQTYVPSDNKNLAYKAAELQGRIRAERFIHLMQNEIIPKRDIITEDMICDCIKNAGIDYEVFKEDLQKSKLTDSLKVDLHIAREMDIEQAPSLVFFSEDVHEEGLKVEGLYPYHIYTYIINELMGKPIEKNLPPKLEQYIKKKQLVTMEELLTIYEWPEKLLNKELKKLSLQQKVEKLQYPEGDFWKSKMPQC